MKGIIATISAGVLLVAFAGVTTAHPHEVHTKHHSQVLANGQNHPGFTLNDDGTAISCEGVLEPSNSGPAGWGLETAHHGPDAGKPGKADGCYVVVTDILPPPDNNPAID